MADHTTCGIEDVGLLRVFEDLAFDGAATDERYPDSSKCRKVLRVEDARRHRAHLHVLAEAGRYNAWTAAGILGAVHRPGVIRISDPPSRHVDFESPIVMPRRFSHRCTDRVTVGGAVKIVDWIPVACDRDIDKRA